MNAPYDDAPHCDERTQAAARYTAVRTRTLALAAPLSAEDQVVQSMPDASPTKWHLGHGSWFFETFLLIPYLAGYCLFDPDFAYLFNSYYEAMGARQPRTERGLLTRPRLEAVMAYRAHVDAAMADLLQDLPPALDGLFDLGLAHEEQHQELILMDILHLFSVSPLAPAYDPAHREPPKVDCAAKMLAFEGGVVEIGRAGSGFAFDNEGPRHKVYLEPFQLSDSLVTNAEWLDFIAADGYRQPRWWLSEGWALVTAQGWDAPSYWRKDGDDWLEMTLAGLRPLDPVAPVRHISYYEADAFAAWAGARLPSEAEWEHAEPQLREASGAVWQWTRSSYSAYPRFSSGPGAVGEYNGKFMVGQMVLRGGAGFTSAGHTRPTYRNFFHPHQRWMQSGLRLAKDGLAEQSDLARDVAAGLSAKPKALSPKYFYDAEGSRLFEAICDQPEYYPTRAEMALLDRVRPLIAAEIPDNAALVEFGSGAGVKTRQLLDVAPQIAVYSPIDISPDAIEAANAALAADYPRLTIAPMVGDFTQPMRLPSAAHERHRVGFFPGSTIGNFTPEMATAFLANCLVMLGPKSRFIVGFDLSKDPVILEAAYDDAAGVTAAFNKNLLYRLNRELGADFDLAAFDHKALWNAAEGRVEMHLVSCRDQTVRIKGATYPFAAGETIHTENAYKFTPERFAAMAQAAGWRVIQSHQSHDPAFAISVLAPA